MDVPDIKTVLIYGLAAGISLSYVRYWLQKSTIPAMGDSSGPISSYLAALRFLRYPSQTVWTEYLKDRDGVFRIPALFRWDYIVSGRQRVLEIGAVPEHTGILSFDEAVADTLQIQWTMGLEIATNTYHLGAIRGSLTRNLGRCFPEVHDEIVHAFHDALALEGNEWKSVTVMPTILQVVARTSNRLFVGLPLCREPEYVQLNIDHTVAVFMRSQLIRLIPDFLKPILAPIFSSRKSSLRHALKFLRPILDERLRNEEKYGRDWPDRPNDLISWLLDIAPEGIERTAPGLARRLLSVNIAAIHTTSIALVAALYDLAAYPEHTAPMREEAERIIAQEGWTKAALGKMHKIDSFLRESQRVNSTGPVIMVRRVVAPEGFTFSDGITIPHGAYLSVSMAAHLDPEIYENPRVFDGFRFSRQRPAPTSVEDAETIHPNSHSDTGRIFNQQMISTAPTHFVFGHGRHACPGRFLATTELKAMLAHILINYDIKAEREGVRPPDVEFGYIRTPSPAGRIWIRKRERDSTAA